MFNGMITYNNNDRQTKIMIVHQDSLIPNMSKSSWLWCIFMQVISMQMIIQIYWIWNLQTTNTKFCYHTLWITRKYHAKLKWETSQLKFSNYMVKIMDYRYTKYNNSTGPTTIWLWVYFGNEYESSDKRNQLQDWQKEDWGK